MLMRLNYEREGANAIKIDTGYNDIKINPVIFRPIYSDFFFRSLKSVT